MTGTDLALIIAAIGGGGGGITAIGNFIVQMKTMRIQQQAAKALAHNTEITEKATAAAMQAQAAASAASLAAAQTTQGLGSVIAKVEESKMLSAANATNIATVLANVAVVSNTIDTVAESATASVDRIAAAKLAEGLAVGHVQGVAAEQARVSGMTQQMKALTESG